MMQPQNLALWKTFTSRLPEVSRPTSDRQPSMNLAFVERDHGDALAARIQDISDFSTGYTEI